MITTQIEKNDSMFYFIRHGERADESPIEYKDVKNFDDPHLTKIGRQQAVLTGIKLKLIFRQQPNQKIVILSSPFLRCLETARLIAGQLDTKEIHVQPELCEALYPHIFQDDPMPTLVGNFVSSYLRKPLFKLKEVKFPETRKQVEQRIEEVFQHMLNKAEKNTQYILVTHQRPVKTVLGLLNQKSRVDYCAVASFDTNKNCYLSGETLY